MDHSMENFGGGSAVFLLDDDMTKEMSADGKETILGRQWTDRSILKINLTKK